MLMRLQVDHDVMHSFWITYHIIFAHKGEVALSFGEVIPPPSSLLNSVAFKYKENFG